MRGTRIGPAALVAALGLATGTAIGQGETPAPGDRPTAGAELKDAQGRPVGRITLTQHPAGVVVHGELTGLPQGWHALHVHETGRCEPTFRAAGGHFNPTGVTHGLDDGGPHAGDLPNIWADRSGEARFEMVTDRFSLREAARASGAGTSGAAAPAARTAPTIFDRDGAALVAHAGADDYHTDPAGASGDRIACGVIARR